MFFLVKIGASSAEHGDSWLDTNDDGAGDDDAYAAYDMYGSERVSAGVSGWTHEQRRSIATCWPLLLSLLLAVSLALLGMPGVAAHSGSHKHHLHTTSGAKHTKAGTQAKAAGQQTLNVSSVIQATLNDIATNGYDPIKNGLWVNWSTGTQPLEVDFVAGKPTCLISQGHIKCAFSPAHDVLTDLRYLHNLWTYKVNHPGDHTYDVQVQLYTPIVLNEFADFANLSTSGWLFDEWLNLAQLSGDNRYLNLAHDEANFWYTHYYHANLGAVYFTNSGSNGVYRVDYTIEIAAALFEAGYVFQQPQWTQAGKQAIQFIYLHAYNAQYHLFPLAMANVVKGNGSANDCETFETSQSVQGNGVSASANLHIALAFLRTYLTTNNGMFLAHAIDLLQSFSVSNNVAGFWDTTYGGYFARGQFSGSGYCSFGRFSITNTEKEGGRMLATLETYHVADWIMGNPYSTTENALINVAINKAYLPAGQGYMFVQAQNWSLLGIEDCGGVNTCVTTEAMGIALEALESLQAAHPW